MNAFAELAVDPEAWVALATLIAMEIILGIDNLIFISVLTNKLTPRLRNRARRVGIGFALVLRLILLGTVAWIIQLTEPVLTIFSESFSWRDIILLGGGLFLVWKATTEIHHNVERRGPEADPDPTTKPTVGFSAAVAQIIVLDLVFSIDSIVTAVGMTPHIPIMVVAVIVAILVMLLAVNPLSRFIHDNPTIIMLALGFLLMIGMVLIAEGFGAHIPKGYIYSAMAFSAGVEGLNMLARRRRQNLLIVREGR